MSESVRGIFKTLLKIPIIILVCFAIFNVFAFGLSYMKVLGVSYVVMQTAMENNFIPEQEKTTIETYMNNTVATGILQDVKITDNTTFEKGQYGEVITVGVEANYRFIWPLTPLEQINGEFNGMKGQNTFGGYLSGGELEAMRNEQNNKKSNIRIEYVVPGLKYYPDLN